MYEETESKDTLYIGVDDSNHAGKNKKGEIILATFSYNPFDGKVQRQSSRRDAQRVSSWIGETGHDYRFAILSDEDSRHRSYNVVLIAPLLIGAYLAEVRPKISRLSIACDGPVRKNHKQYIRVNFPEYTVQVEGFIKKSYHGGKLQSSHIMPYVVSTADTWANWLYTQPLETLATDNKIVALSSLVVAEKDQQIRRFSQ